MSFLSLSADGVTLHPIDKRRLFEGKFFCSLGDVGWLALLTSSIGFISLPIDNLRLLEGGLGTILVLNCLLIGSRDGKRTISELLSFIIMRWFPRKLFSCPEVNFGHVRDILCLSVASNCESCNESFGICAIRAGELFRLNGMSLPMSQLPSNIFTSSDELRRTDSTLLSVKSLG